MAPFGVPSQQRPEPRRRATAASTTADRRVLQADRAAERSGSARSRDRAARTRRPSAASPSPRAGASASVDLPCPRQARHHHARARPARPPMRAAVDSGVAPSAICRFIPISAASSPCAQRQRRRLRQDVIAADHRPPVVRSCRHGRRSEQADVEIGHGVVRLRIIAAYRLRAARSTGARQSDPTRKATGPMRYRKDVPHRPRAGTASTSPAATSSSSRADNACSSYHRRASHSRVARRSRWSSSQRRCSGLAERRQDLRARVRGR